MSLIIIFSVLVFFLTVIRPGVASSGFSLGPSVHRLQAAPLLLPLWLGQRALPPSLPSPYRVQRPPQR